MATLDKLVDGKMVRLEGYPVGSLRLDTVMAVLTAVLGIGLYFDGWAHNTFSDLIETFFTPYHALLYGGFFVATAVLVWTAVQSKRKGHIWSQSLPKAYIPAMLGVVLFTMGGGDLLWHELFGFEEGIEPLLSPTHLLLLIGGLLLGSAPLRSVWKRPFDHNESHWRQLLPAVISLLLIVSTLTFFTQYTHFSRTWFLTDVPDNGFQNYSFSVIAIYAQLMPALIITGGLLFLIRRWTLPVGAITAVVFINYLGMYLMIFVESSDTPTTLTAAFASGLIGEVAYRTLKSSPERTVPLRLFAFLIPFLMSSLYIASLLFSTTIW